MSVSEEVTLLVRKVNEVSSISAMNATKSLRTTTMTDDKRTDDGWPVPLGRELDERLDVVVEFTYRVFDLQDASFVYLAAAAVPRSSSTTSPPSAPAPNAPTADDDGVDAAVPPPDATPVAEHDVPHHAESASRRKRQQRRRGQVYDHLDDVPAQFKRRAFLDDLPISIKRARQNMTLYERFAFAVERSEGHQQSLAKKVRGELKVTDVLRDAGDLRAMIKRSLQNSVEKEWATWGSMMPSLSSPQPTRRRFPTTPRFRRAPSA